jgi:hypothetical protein
MVRGRRKRPRADDDDLLLFAAVRSRYVRMALLLSLERGRARLDLADPFADCAIRMPGLRLNLASMCTTECLRFFRFTLSELKQLVVELELPGIVITREGYACNALEGIAVLCRRLAYPNRLVDLEPMFHRSSSALCAIALHMVMDLWRRFKGVVEWDRDRIAAKLPIYAAAIRGKGAPLDTCWGFIDGTARSICRPGRYQRVAFSGHKRMHKLKYQAIATPDGLISHFFGPVEGRRHDVVVLRESGIQARLEGDAAFAGYVIYGDGGYACKSFLVAPYRGAELSPDQRAFNLAMSRMRICVEWMFGYVIKYWAFVDFTKTQKALLSPVGPMYGVCVLLVNCRTCIAGGNQTSESFRLTPDSLHQYLHHHA